MRNELGHSRGARPCCVKQKLWKWPGREFRTKAWASRLCSRYLCMSQKSRTRFAFQGHKQSLVQASKSHLRLHNWSCCCSAWACRLPEALQSRLVNVITFALSDCSRLTCAMQYVFLLPSNDSLPLHAQDCDLSLKLAVVGTGNCRGVVSPEKAKSALLCARSVDLALVSLFSFPAQGPISPMNMLCPQLPAMPN